jgi:hypothetical protein
MSALGVVIPGTNITPIVEKLFSEKRDDDQLPVVKLGAGLIQSGDTLLAVRAGLLHFTKPNKFWIEGHQKRVYSSFSSYTLVHTGPQ